MGHVRDLPKSKLGVDVDKDFAPDYVAVKGKKDAMKKIFQQARKAKQIYLATDPDREGEAIAWHVYQSFKTNSKFPLKSKKVGRIVFHEITKSAVEESLKHVTKLNLLLVLDRLVGYKLSPLLWKKVRRGLSAGRVQSVAVRLIVDREKEREAFKPEEFWIIGADLQPSVKKHLGGGEPKKYKNDSASSEVNNGKQVFWAELKKKDDKKFQAKSKKQADPVVKDLKSASYSVTDVKKRQVTKSAPPPFTTSILQQRAASRFGWSAKRTMRAAQRLYEQGLITYHRTDSYNLAPKAITSVRNFIQKEYGPKYLPEKPNFFKKKSKLAQEAHEAIRPTNVARTSPSFRAKSRQGRDKAKNPPRKSNALSHGDQAKLYSLIHQRFVACQMTPAIWDETRVQISAVKKPITYTLSATGRIEKFLGWRVVYQQSSKNLRGGKPSKNAKDTISPEVKRSKGKVLSRSHSGLDPESSKKILKQVQDDANSILPPLVPDQSLDLLKVTSEQKFTQPPPRYGVASLIKELEKLGIGRPSTYAPIISTIQDRQYVELKDKSFLPTPVGFAVTEFLLTNFPKVMDYQFTAGMEENLDHIAQGEKSWVPVIREFYTPFSDKLVHVEEKSKRVKIATEKTGEKCPECKKGDTVIRVGRFGKFLSCSRFPDCKHTANFVEKIDMKCPDCSKGEVIIKTTKKRRKFFGCSRYPDCKWASWRRPKALK
jgi:DNA topoisomerase-1